MTLIFFLVSFAQIDKNLLGKFSFQEKFRNIRQIFSFNLKTKSISEALESAEMYLNKIGVYTRNLVQSSRISSFLNFTRNRNDSTSFFHKPDQVESQGNSQPVRRVSTT